MRTTVDSRLGKATLVFCHCAGSIDIVALPIWVGIVLIGQYGLDPQRAGGLATLFLAAVVVSSILLAPRIDRVRGTWAAPAGLAIAATAFLALCATRDYTAMAVLHVLAGLGVGCALTFTDVAIGASKNPHRLMAITYTTLSVLALVFLGIVPPLVASLGGYVLFASLGVIMLAAALVVALGFPQRPNAIRPSQAPGYAPLSGGVWFAMVGTGLMTLNQAMMFSFLEPVGAMHGFSREQVMTVLIAVGVVNLFPAVFAAAFERRVSARAILVAGPIVQGALGLVITQSTAFAPYAVAASIYVSVFIFTHTFIFAFLARNDPSMRAVGATPAMAMTGSALGPIIGGVAAHHLGYASIGWAALTVGAIAALCLWQAGRRGTGATRIAHATVPPASA